jgi:ParB-like chromosome segregation protein Spo0J
MSWRERYKVHPAADEFPWISDEELQKLVEDIKAHGLRHPIVTKIINGEQVIIDGRHRLEACERAAFKLNGTHFVTLGENDDPVSYIITANIHRRHLAGTQAEILVKIAKLELGQNRITDDPVSERPEVNKGGRGKVNPVKARVLALNRALPKSKRVSEPTIKRALAKAEGKKPARPKWARDDAAEVKTNGKRYKRQLERAREAYALLVSKLAMATAVTEIDRFKRRVGELRGTLQAHSLSQGKRGHDLPSEANTRHPARA